MTKPRHGKLFQHSVGDWTFCPGNTVDVSKGIKWPDLFANCQTLLHSGQLFHGHAKFPRIYQTHNQVHLKVSVLQYVSAHGLSNLIVSTSLKQLQTFSDDDQEIWKAAYNEEFNGLSSIPTWKIITESQFKTLNKSIKPSSIYGYHYNKI